MKNITIAGGVTRDAELRTVGGNGDKVLGFSVAVSEGFGDKKRTLYFDCSIWGKRAETLASMIAKGTKLTVSGDLSTREHDGKTYLTIRASDVTLQSGKLMGHNNPPSGNHAGGADDMSDDIPW